MRYLIVLWLAPLGLFWSWYFLSANDLNMGTIYFSRELHDAIFRIYGNTLGVAPDAVPSMIASACIFDSAIIGAIIAFRWRKSWWPQTSTWVRSQFRGSSSISPQVGPEIEVGEIFPRSDIGKPVERALQDETRGDRVDTLRSLTA